mmetsp:Transcript_37632/g.76966  ORF Transcript_37632/g.76966 Transcript_37632/m.76966 type:complete len:200 (+) Transcript_37632:32-631(+)
MSHGLSPSKLATNWNEQKQDDPGIRQPEDDVHGLVHQENEQCPVVQETKAIYCEDFSREETIAGSQPTQDAKGLHELCLAPEDSIKGGIHVQALVQIGRPGQRKADEQDKPISAVVLTHCLPIHQAVGLCHHTQDHDVEQMERPLLWTAIHQGSVDQGIGHDHPGNDRGFDPNGSEGPQKEEVRQGEEGIGAQVSHKVL